MQPLGVQAPMQAVATAPAPSPCVEISGSVDCDQGKEQTTNKRPRSESTAQPSTKACREKIRRDKLNERFLELGAILEPGKTPKMDKSAILNDAIRVVGELRSEAKKLKDSNESLQEKIKELKVCPLSYGQVIYVAVQMGDGVFCCSGTSYCFIFLIYDHLFHSVKLFI